MPDALIAVDSISVDSISFDSIALLLGIYCIDAVNAFPQIDRTLRDNPLRSRN